MAPAGMQYIYWSTFFVIIINSLNLIPQTTGDNPKPPNTFHSEPQQRCQEMLHFRPWLCPHLTSQS